MNDETTWNILPTSKTNRIISDASGKAGKKASSSLAFAACVYAYGEGAPLMSLMQLIYASTPFGFDSPTLNQILSVAKRNNARDGITGCLICRADFYLQMLEGPRGVVTAAFHRILRDDRHLDVVLISSGDVQVRMFADWSMRDDPARSWMWSQADITGGAIEAASDMDVRAVFRRVATES
jgi:Sensors of blue-light using FAD